MEIFITICTCEGGKKNQFVTTTNDGRENRIVP